MNVWLSEIWRAWRASFRRPGFLLLATGVLALGIGATSAVFTMIDATLLQPLPYREPARLIAVGQLEDGGVQGASPQQYQHMLQLEGVQSIGIYQGALPVNIAGSGLPVQVPAMHMDRGLLSTLGVQLQLGRNFTAEENRPHGPQAMLVSHDFWLRRFGGRTDIVGQSLRVEGISHTIVGVLPVSFNLGAGDIVLPTAFATNSTDDGTNYTVIARLDDGVEAAAVAEHVQARLHAMYVDAGGDNFWIKQHFGVQNLQTFLNSEIQPTLLMWMACALLLLLIALVNLTNLMLLRTLSRAHQSSVRGALGASLWRLALPSLADGLLAGIGGIVIGQALAAGGLFALRHAMPIDWMPIEWAGGSAIHLGAMAWLLAAGVGIFGSLLATGLGVWRGRHASSFNELREGGRSGLDVRSGRLGRALVVAQMALATTLLCAAGMFVHTLYDASKVNLGFHADGILTFELAPITANYPDALAVQTLSHQLVDRLRLLPGVTDAVATTNLPAGDFFGQFNLGGLHLPGGEQFNAQFRGVGNRFFSLFDIHMREGRAFMRTDVRGGETVAVINQRLADQAYGGHAVGQLIQRGQGKDMLSARIIGVVADTYQFGPLNPHSVVPILYLPLTQTPDDAMGAFRSFEPMRFALKVHGRPDEYRKSILQAVAEVAPDQPIAHVRTMNEVIFNDILSPSYFNLWLVSLFAVLALLLAAVGMYSVMAVAVAAREPEFGVRAALGASPARLVQLVLRGGLRQILLGLLLGVMITLALSRVLRSLIEQLGRHAFDPLAVLGVCALLAVAGVLACLVPALRAARVHPMRALRGE
ncbi:MAG: ABC transporter permease [Rhodanobacter sp.]